MDAENHRIPVSLGNEIKEKIYANFNITASVGIAKNWLMAKLASKLNKPNNLILIDDSNFEQILRQAPLSKLCGMGGKNGRILMAQGLETCWDLYLNLPAFFSENPDKFNENCSRLPKSISHSYNTLSNPQINPQVIRVWLRLLSEMVAVRLRQQNLVTQTWINDSVGGGTENLPDQTTAESLKSWLN